MAKQEQKKKKESKPSEEAVTASAEVIEKGKKTEEELDALMDEIDDVLEENAEEFIKNYVQKGGE